VIDTIAYTAQDIWSLQVAIRDITNNLLVLSSGDVYKVYDTFLRSLPGADNAPATENSPLRDHLFPYKPERTNKYDDLLFNYDKIVVERMIDRQYFNTCILRLPAVFGAGDKQKRFSEYIQPMLAGQPFIKLDPKKAKWIWTRSYVENAAYGIYLAATKPEASNEVFNLGDIHLSELELINKLKSLTGWKGEIILESSTSESYNFDQHLIMDSSKIRKLLSYNEPVKLEAAMERTIQGYIS
jgi:nucleoside-diphosphate-sugar epimerase